MHDPVEAASVRFRPAQVRVLFVAESARARTTSFYSMDSQLYSATKDVFNASVRDLLRAQNFLRSFQQLGCYLVNLYDQPLHAVPETEHEATRQESVERLADALREMQPTAVISVEPSIARHVDDAIDRSGWSPEVRADLPFPHRQHTAAYSSELKRVLSELRSRGVLGR